MRRTSSPPTAPPSDPRDRALAEQIIADQETLAALHQTVEITRDNTNVLRQETAVQKKELDRQLGLNESVMRTKLMRPGA